MKLPSDVNLLLWRLTRGDEALTDELRRKYHKIHFCYEWDGLCIYEDSPEFDACLCDFGVEEE